MPDKEIPKGEVKIEEKVDADPVLKDLEPKEDVKGGGFYWNEPDYSGT
jgi:hypothetical protein